MQQIESSRMFDGKKFRANLSLVASDYLGPTDDEIEKARQNMRRFQTLATKWHKEWKSLQAKAKAFRK